MFGRQKTGSVLCPSCGLLVGVNDRRCLNCGRVRPGLFGFTAALRNLGHDLGFASLVLWVCGALWIAMLVAGREGAQAGGLLSLLSPSGPILFLFGASGAMPVFGAGRWWTVLSAPWLHAGLIHIGFNMLAVRDLVPPLSRLYGPARIVIIYVSAGVVGATLTSLGGRYLPPIPFISLGARGISVGASGAVFGLIGALFHYGWRGGSRAVREHATRWALAGLVFGLVVPGIDNLCHLGGLLGGYLVSRVLDPLKPERTDHVVIALGCLLASAAAIAWSILDGLQYLK
jgi:membrane associated rhomboid family serine protease